MNIYIACTLYMAISKECVPSKPSKTISLTELFQYNILIASSGRAYIADFGQSTTKDSKPVVMTNTTCGSSGTMRWQAPELLDSELEDTGRPNTRATDVYAFGMVCYEVRQIYKATAQLPLRLAWQMFSGDFPFHDISDYVFMSALKRERRPSRPLHPLSAARRLDDGMWHLIEACWGQNPIERPGADCIVQSLRLLPNRGDDKRPHSEFNSTSASKMWSKQEHHPFSALAPSPTDTDMLQHLKWASG